MPDVFCNPDVCPCCQYIGEGDSWCDETGEIVLENWMPTEHFMGNGCPYMIKKRRKTLNITLSQNWLLLECRNTSILV